MQCINEHMKCFGLLDVQTAELLYLSIYCLSPPSASSLNSTTWMAVSCGNYVPAQEETRFLVLTALYHFTPLTTL